MSSQAAVPSAACCLLHEWYLIGYVLHFRFVYFVFTVKNEESFVLGRAWVSIESACLKSLVGIVAAEGMHRIGDELIRFCLRQVTIHTDGEESRSAPSVAHRDCLDGKAGISRFIVDIETCGEACQLEAQLHTGGVIETCQVDRCCVGASHSKGSSQRVALGCCGEQAGMPGGEDRLLGNSFSSKLRITVFALGECDGGEVCRLDFLIVCRVDECGIVGDTVQFDEESFFEFEQPVRFVAVGIGGVELQLSGVLGQFVVGIGAVGEALEEGVVAVFLRSSEDVHVERRNGVFGGGGDGCFCFRPGSSVCGFRRYGFNRQLIFQSHQNFPAGIVRVGSDRVCALLFCLFRAATQ